MPDRATLRAAVAIYDMFSGDDLKVFALSAEITERTQGKIIPLLMDDLASQLFKKIINTI